MKRLKVCDINEAFKILLHVGVCVCVERTHAHTARIICNVMVIDRSIKITVTS